MVKKYVFIFGFLLIIGTAIALSLLQTSDVPSKDEAWRSTLPSKDALPSPRVTEITDTSVSDDTFKVPDVIEINKKIALSNTREWVPVSVFGLSFTYPNDYTYGVGISTGSDTDGNLNEENITIGQDHPGNVFHIAIVKDLSDTPMNINPTGKKIINGVSYGTFFYDGEGDRYGYVTEHNGKLYVFQSVWGPTNEVFEKFMTTIQFK